MSCQLRKDAAKYIQEHGWTTGTLLSDDGKVCMLGALGMACGLDLHNMHVREQVYGDDNDDPNHGSSIPLIQSAIKSMGFTYVDDVWNFNDNTDEQTVTNRLLEGCPQ